MLSSGMVHLPHGIPRRFATFTCKIDIIQGKSAQRDLFIIKREKGEDWHSNLLEEFEITRFFCHFLTILSISWDKNRLKNNNQIIISFR